MSITPRHYLQPQKLQSAHASVEGDVEGEAECEDEDHEDQDDGHQGLQDLQEHHHVDAEALKPAQSCGKTKWKLKQSSDCLITLRRTL